MGATDLKSLFRELLEEHSRLIFKVVHSFTDGPSDADDLFQEIAMQVWRSLPHFRAESKATTWLYRVALNTALGWKRREDGKRKQALPLSTVAEVADDAAPAGEREAQREMLERLYVAIRALPPTDRALVLLYLDNLQYREIAEVIGISESNVGVRLNRVKKKLAEQMKVSSDVA